MVAKETDFLEMVSSHNSRAEHDIMLLYPTSIDATEKKNNSPVSICPFHLPGH